MNYSEQLSKKQIKKFFKKTRRNKEVVLVLENMQYARNVASVFRTADAAGVQKLYLTGISQQPPFGKDLRKASRNKEKSVQWEYAEQSSLLLNKLRKEGFYIIVVELTNDAEDIYRLSYIIADKKKVAFVFGNEVHGVSKASLKRAHASVYIPMYGKGASLNVGTTVGIALYSF